MNLRALLAVPLAVAAALCICAAPASATVATSPEGGIYQGTIEAQSEGEIKLHSSFFSVNCQTSTVEGAIEEQGESVTAKGKLSTLDFGECNSTITVLSLGTWEFHNAGGSNGTVTSTGTKITIHSSVGVSCTYETNNTDIGFLTSSPTTGGSATIDLASAAIPRTGDSALCGSKGTLTGSYVIKVPATLSLDAAVPDMEGHFYTPDAQKTNLVGTESDTHRLEWTVDGLDGGVVCDESTWQKARDYHSEVFMIFNPTFPKCHTTDSTDNFAIEMNGCTFFFWIAKKTDNNTEQTAWFACGGKRAVIKDPSCTIKIPSQEFTDGVTYTQITLNDKHAVTIDFKARLKKIETEGGCGVAADKLGWLEGSLTVEAFDRQTDPPTRTHLTAT